ncbi:MAG TPA: hypothetical protein VLA52_07415 [Thermohalobaculum sp.]|nr:hypothetical protein [Thermohalobaculum sp.]
MKFDLAPGTGISVGIEALQLLLLLVAIPSALSLFFGIRKEPVILMTFLFGSAAVLAR